MKSASIPLSAEDRQREISNLNSTGQSVLRYNKAAQAYISKTPSYYPLTYCPKKLQQKNIPTPIIQKG